jgi:hypothetical protein
VQIKLNAENEKKKDEDAANGVVEGAHETAVGNAIAAS